MSGHSKWSKIKHQKAVTDVRKAKMFSKLLRFIAVEAKKTKGDRNAPSLRTAVEKARTANIPSDTIDRAIEKAAGALGEVEAVTYEAYGPGGTAIIVEGYTDSRNRTSQEIKHLLGLSGGTLAMPGAAMWAFSRASGTLEPITTVKLSAEDLEKLAALVDQLEEHDDVSEVHTNAA